MAKRNIERCKDCGEWKIPRLAYPKTGRMTWEHVCKNGAK